MFVPFVFSMSTFVDAPYLWWFCKGLDFIKRNNSAMIAQEIYCTTPISEFAAKGRREVFDQALVDSSWGYKLPKNRDIQSKRLYSIPDHLLDELIREQGGITNCFCYLLSQSYPLFEDFLYNLMSRIELECGEKIEGFITLMHCPSLSAAAKRRNIPVIHFEMGCWREPTYLQTAFWDLESTTGGTTLEKRWKKFCQENEQRQISIFSKQECLATLLKKENLRYITLCDQKPKKKIGVILGYATYELFSYKTHLNDAEMLYRVKKAYGLEHMLIRKHPGDPYGAQYPIYTAAMDQVRRSTPEFIADCETIISLLSGSGMEAMLYDRKAITLLPSPSYLASGHEIEGKGLCAGEDFISFFAFCYLIPLEYLMDVEYLRWRLTNPSEREIYYKHIKFYFDKKKIPKELIIQETGSRLSRMLSVQGYQQ